MNPECGNECCPGCRSVAVAKSEFGLRDIEDAAYKVQLQPNIKTLTELTKSWNRWNHQGNISLESEMAMLCLDSFDALGATLINNVDEARRHEQGFVDIWPTILKWIMIVFSSRLRGKDHDSPPLTLFEEEAANAIVQVLFVLVFIPALRDIMAATPELLEIAASLWLLEDKTDTGGPVAVASPLISGFLGRLEDVTPVLDKLMAAAGDNPDTVLRIACARIERRLTSENLEHENQRILDNLTILDSSAAVKQGGYPMRRACVQVNVIPTCIAALEWIAAMLKAKGPNSLLSDMTYPAFSCIRGCLEIGNGYSEVLQAVRCGLIEVFIECSAEYSSWFSDQRDDIFEIFRSVIPKYLVYRPVTKATYQVLSRLVSVISARRIGDELACTVLIRLHNLSVQYHSLIAKSRTTPILCDNWKCSESRIKSNFLTCNACHFAWYCSPECQKADWKTGSCHKHNCPILRHTYLDHGPKAMFRDKTFLHELSLYVVRFNMPNLPDIIKRRHPSSSISSLVLLIDFQKVPVGCSLLSREEIVADMKEHPVGPDGANGVITLVSLALESAQWRNRLLVVSVIDQGEVEYGWTTQQTFLDSASERHIFIPLA